MKVSDLPSLDTITDPTLIIPQEEIDRINDLYADMRRRGKKLLKDAVEIGQWFIEARKKIGPYLNFHSWVTAKFPKIPRDFVYRSQQLARDREFFATLMRDDSVFGVNEASRLYRQYRKEAKPRIRRIVVRKDADPLILLEAKLKNYVINLWMLRYLQTEIEGLLTSMELTPAQVLKVLRYVCKEHHEVEDEVLRTFKPGLKIVSKGA